MTTTGWAKKTATLALAALALLLHAGCGRREAAMLAPPEPDYAVVRVHYATDRSPALVPGSLLNYGSARSPGGKLALGTCDVSIPRDHRMGQIERPSVWRLEFREDPAKHVVLRRVEQQSYESFYADLQTRVAAAPQREVFVFVHGFKVPFQDAVLRTAQLTYDLGFAGAPVLYSWPSEGELLRYTIDGNNAEWTAPHLTWFLQDLAARSGAQSIHVIAHSMGNRALLRAIDRIVQRPARPLPLFSQAVLMAPDVDADIFEQLADSLKTATSRATLYASSNDQALVLSKGVNGYRRAGDVAQGILLIAGIDSIDVSAVDTSLIGHFYYGERRSVLSDVIELLRGVPVAQRGLQEVPKPPLKYYRFLP